MNGGNSTLWVHLFLNNEYRCMCCLFQGRIEQGNRPVSIILMCFGVETALYCFCIQQSCRLHRKILEGCKLTWSRQISTDFFPTEWKLSKGAQPLVSLRSYCLRNQLSGKNVYEHFKRHPKVYGVLHGALLSRSLAIEYIKSGLLMKRRVSLPARPPVGIVWVL